MQSIIFKLLVKPLLRLNGLWRIVPFWLLVSLIVLLFVCLYDCFSMLGGVYICVLCVNVCFHAIECTLSASIDFYK